MLSRTWRLQWDGHEELAQFSRCNELKAEKRNLLVCWDRRSYCYRLCWQCRAVVFDEYFSLISKILFPYEAEKLIIMQAKPSTSILLQPPQMSGGPICRSQCNITGNQSRWLSCAFITFSRKRLYNHGGPGHKAVRTRLQNDPETAGDSADFAGDAAQTESHHFRHNSSG